MLMIQSNGKNRAITDKNGKTAGLKKEAKTEINSKTPVKKNVVHSVI